jgi:hypothetical protein
LPLTAVSDDGTTLFEKEYHQNEVAKRSWPIQIPPH